MLFPLSQFSYCCAPLQSPNSAGSAGPCPQGLLGFQNGDSEKTLANSRSRVSKNIGDFDCFKLAVGLVIG